ncbi:MAG: hypothetical protein CL838_03120 [Crocinitomicaceae bacterium]|nr:hypothetical protein [Crocinitomicaceae bacterium]
MLYNSLIQYIVKSFFLLCFLVFITQYKAQDSTSSNSNYFSIEGQIYPAFNNDDYRPKVKVRFFLNPKSALRLNLNTTRTSLYHEIYEINGLGVGSVEKINSLQQFSFGYEGHKQIKTTNLYTGIEGIVGFGRNDEYGSRTDSLTFIADENYSIKRPIRQFGVRVFSGFDQFLTENLFIGAEFGLLFLQTNNLVGSLIQVDGSSQTSSEVTTLIPKSNVQQLTLNGLGCIRIGWVF